MQRIVIALAALAATGCATMGFSYDEDSLKESVAFENPECSAENIEIVRAMEAGTGHSKFVVNVCGEEQRWNRMGTSYFAEGKGPMD